ncbi:hypothetical protein EBQ93_02285, partial [bacterium]|nr:hypothetical protein [bacterium]
SLTIGGNYDYIDAQTPPTDTTQDPETDTGTDMTPDIPNNPGDGGSSGDDESQNTDTTESDTSSSSDGQDDNPSQNPDTAPSNNDTLSVAEIQGAVNNLIADGNITAADASAVLDILAADGSITATEVANLSEVLAADGVLNLVEKDLLADALIQSANGEAISVADIKAAGLEYRDLPPATPVETRTDMNGNPVVVTAEVASALLTLESPAALISGIAACINPDEAIEGLTEEQKCEIFKALSNIGADMSPQERQKAKEVLVAAVLVGQVILGSSILRIRG